MAKRSVKNVYESFLSESLEIGFARGFEIGFEKGVDQCKRQTIQLILEDRFGTMPQQMVRLIKSWPQESFLKLVRLTTRIRSLNELKEITHQNSSGLSYCGTLHN